MPRTVPGEPSNPVRWLCSLGRYRSRVRICLISTGSIARDPRALAEASSLMQVGHEVFGVSSATNEPPWVTAVLPPRLGDRLRRRGTVEQLGRTAATLDCDLYQPLSPAGVHSASVAAQGRQSASVLGKPTWPRPIRQDLIALAPANPTRSTPATGVEPSLHRPSYTLPHVKARVGSVVLAYRRTDRNPGRYIQSAFERTGLDVVQVDEIDWTTIDPSTLAVVIVESPLPALLIKGTNTGVPVAFWVHHGEHHVDANVRLQRRYGAQLVLQAHSWHLAHRFEGVVDRLPFGVPPELFDRGFKPHADRTWDIGFVGARSAPGGRYERRQKLLDDLADRLGKEHVHFRSDVSPQAIERVYSNSRVVIDDGLGRHLPITMRAFEATAAGALLVSNQAPGTELLFEPTREFVQMGSDAATQIEAVLKQGTEEVGRRGHGRAWRDHTYDVRVAELLGAIERARDLHADVGPPAARPSGLAGIVDRFVDAQRVLDLSDSMEDLPGREIWPFDLAAERAEAGTFHLAVISGGSNEDRIRAVAAARMGAVVPPGDPDGIEALVRKAHGFAERYDFESGTVFTFGTTGYRVSNEPDPD